MTNFKKVVAGLSALTILAASTLNVNAANISDVTVNTDNDVAANEVVTSIAFTPATALVDGDSFIVTYDADMVDTSFADANVTAVSNGDGVFAATVDTTNNLINVAVTTAGTTPAATVTLTLDANLVAPATADIVSFGVIHGGDTGVSTVYVENENDVVVTANVLPVLTMVIDNATVDLGNLSSSQVEDSDSDTSITIATNANGGYILSAEATEFTGAATSNVIPFVTRAAQAINTEGFSIDATVTKDAAGDVTVNGDGDATANGGEGVASTFAVSDTTANLVESDGTTDGDVIAVNYAASISAVTEADNYSTTVTYTLTGRF